MDADRWRAVFDRVERLIEDRWGIPVRIRDVPNPFTGDLDGAEISVDHDLEIEDALFIVLHLFGHTVQWNVSPAARAIGLATPAGPWTEDALRDVARYEHEACRYSLQLLHEAGVHELDAAYLLHLYRTGEKRPFRSFWRAGAPLLEPLAIPAFAPARWIGRYEGTVV